MSAPSPILHACIDEFRKTKQAAEQCFEQLRDEELHIRVNPLQNSIAVIIQHMAGNMCSRWTDVLSSDGEKPDRDREGEFAERGLSRAHLLELWDRGWSTLFAALGPLTDADLARVVHIRKAPHTLFQAINRQTAHYNLHLGQIQLIGKHLRGAEWRYLSIPPGGSAAFNRQMGMR